MTFQNRPLLYVAAGLLVVTSVLYITANALPIWATVSTESYTQVVGLWKACKSVGSTKTCINAPWKVDAETMLIRVFISICCILSPLSAASILWILCVNEDLEGKISLLAKRLVIATLICGIIGVVIGLNEVVLIKDVRAKMGVSCILAIIALVMNLAGTIATFCIE